MIKRPLFLFVALSLLVAVCAIAFVRVLFRFDVAEPQPVQAQGVMAVQPTASPQPTATAQPTATGTPNATATAQAEELALLAWQAEIEARQAANKRAELDNLEREGQLLALYDWTPTAQAREAAQTEATAQAEADAEAAYIEQERARIMSEIKADEHAKRTAENIRLILVAMGAGVVFVLVVTVIRMIDYRAKTALFVAATGAATSNPLENLAPVTDAPAGFIPVGASTSHPTRVPVPPEVFAVWARRMLDDGTAGINKWETGDSPFSRNAENGKPAYIPFLDWAIERGYVAESGGAKVLSERGQLFCRGWLQRRGSPPLAAEVPEIAENPMNHAMPCPPDASSEGQGQGKDEG